MDQSVLSTPLPASPIIPTVPSSGNAARDGVIVGGERRFGPAVTCRWSGVVRPMSPVGGKAARTCFHYKGTIRLPTRLGGEAEPVGSDEKTLAGRLRPRYGLYHRKAQRYPRQRRQSSDTALWGSDKDQGRELDYQEPYGNARKKSDVNASGAGRALGPSRRAARRAWRHNNSRARKSAPPGPDCRAPPDRPRADSARHI